MPLSITDILFSTVTSLTGGLVTDLTSLIVAMIGIGFIIMGFDYIRECLERSIVSNRKASAYEDARQYDANYKNAHNDLDRDIARARYKDAVRRAS
jgi:hypothetical protein